MATSKISHKIVTYKFEDLCPAVEAHSSIEAILDWANPHVYPNSIQIVDITKGRALIPTNFWVSNVDGKLHILIYNASATARDAANASFRGTMMAGTINPQVDI